MVEDDTSANIEWEQKKGFSDKTRQSRKIDLQKALAEEAKERNNFKTQGRTPKDLPKNLKKLRTKIKEVYDEEDEEENEVVFHFSLEDESSSLINALKDDEKNKLSFNKTLKNQKMQQTAGKMEAILMADKMSKQLGLNGLKKKVVHENIQDVSLNSETFEKAIAQNVAAKTKIKTKGLSVKDTNNMVKGLQKMKQAAVASEQVDLNQAESLKVEELIKIGKSQDTKKTAEMILEKSGRKEQKKTSKQTKEKENQKVQSAIKQAKQR